MESKRVKQLKAKIKQAEENLENINKNIKEKQLAIIDHSIGYYKTEALAKEIGGLKIKQKAEKKKVDKLNEDLKLYV